jgi:4-aminobutyrate aminotransferase-like enzyme
MPLSIADWSTTISGVLAVTVAAGASIRWIIKHYLIELKPNSGSSMNDRLTRVEAKLEIIYDLITKDKQ